MSLDEQSFIQAAARVFAWVRAVYGTSYAKDVYAYRDHSVWCVAVYGSSFKLQKMVAGSLRNLDYRLDQMLSRALGFDMKVEKYERSSRIRYVSPQFFSSDGEISFPEIVEGVEGGLRELLGEDAAVRFTVIPEGGEPYADGPTRYYSVAKRKFLTSVKPSWVTSVTFRDRREDKVVTLPGANFCAVAAPLRATRSGYAGMRSSRDDMPVIVAHSLEFADYRVTMATAKLIRECGGMLFPSLSVGTLPAANFGPLVLIADPAVVMDGIKPWRKRGAWPVTVYSTDTWTVRTADLVGHASRVLYEQLTGQWDVTYYTQLHLWTLGPPIEQGPAGGRVLGDIGALLRATRRRMKPWMKIHTVDQLKRHKESSSQTESWYGYLEAKVNSVLPMEWFVAAVGPSWLTSSARTWLREAGFRGRLMSVEADPLLRQAYEYGSGSEVRSTDHADLLKIGYAKQVSALVAETMPLLVVTG